MYETRDHPTQELPLLRGRSRRPWLVAAAALGAGLVLLFVAIAACNARPEQAARPLGAIGAPTTVPSATPEPKPGAAEGSGSGDGQTGSGQTGTGQTGGGDPDETPATPEPVSIEVSVADPPVTPGCSATGTIVVTGGEYPMDVVYQWWHLTSLPQPPGQPPQPPLPLPLGPDQSVTLDEAGQATVTSPDFAEANPQNPVRLIVMSPQGAVTDFVTYPKCADLGISG